jgi:hypothetical protein
VPSSPSSALDGLFPSRRRQNSTLCAMRPGSYYEECRIGLIAARSFCGRCLELCGCSVALGGAMLEHRESTSVLIAVRGRRRRCILPRTRVISVPARSLCQCSNWLGAAGAEGGVRGFIFKLPPAYLAKRVQLPTPTAEPSCAAETEPPAPARLCPPHSVRDRRSSSASVALDRQEQSSWDSVPRR